MSETELKPNVVPTEGPTVFDENLVGQNPYTDPPPLARRRFYEDPMPPADATEEQVLQGRGAPAYYPPDAPNPSRMWDPRRYKDQADTPRPVDSEVPDPRADTMTVAQLARLPEEEQDRILSAAREMGGVAPPEFRPTSETVEEQDRKREEGEKLRQEALQQALASRQGGGLSMAPASQGTLTSGQSKDELRDQQNVDE